MKKLAIGIVIAAVIAFLVVLLTLNAEAQIRESDATIARIDKKIEMYERSRR